MDTSETDDLRLGTELLDLATTSTDDPTILEAYNKILAMPRVDSALFMLYKAAEFAFAHPKPLLQSAFMLGYYIHESLGTADKLWEAGLKDDPDDTDWTTKARKEVLD